MSDDLVNRTTAIMMPDYQKGFVNCMSKKRVEIAWLKANDCISYNQGGRSIEWRARLSTGTPFGFLGGMEGHTPAIQNDFQVPTLSWRGLAHAFAASYAERMLCKEDWQIIALLKALSESMTEDWEQEWGTQFYSDGTRLSNTAFHGLAASIPTSPGTFAGLSQTTFTNWANQAIDATGFVADPMNFIHQLILACAVGTKGGRDRNQIDILLGTSTDYRAVVQAEQTKQRVVEQDVKLAKMGFANIACYGVPFAWSEYATSGKIYGLNSALFEFLCAGPDMIDAGVQDSVGFPVLKLGYAIALHQLLNKSPRGSGVLYNTTA